MNNLERILNSIDNDPIPNHSDVCVFMFQNRTNNNNIEMYAFDVKRMKCYNFTAPLNENGEILFDGAMTVYNLWTAESIYKSILDNNTRQPRFRNAKVKWIIINDDPDREISDLIWESIQNIWNDNSNPQPVLKGGKRNRKTKKHKKNVPV